jgi:hypothetical protein
MLLFIVWIITIKVGFSVVFDRSQVIRNDFHYSKATEYSWVLDIVSFNGVTCLYSSVIVSHTKKEIYYISIYIIYLFFVYLCRWLCHTKTRWQKPPIYAVVFAMQNQLGTQAKH